MMISDYESRFSGIGRLYGRKAQPYIQRAHVCIIGIGGVGSWTVEALARSGVGALTLIDLDDVCITNTNRQIHAIDGQIGQPKVDVMAARVQQINPHCNLSVLHDFFTAKTAEQLLDAPYDFVVDAIDSVKHKTLLLAMCKARNIPVVTVGGAGGRRNPSAIRSGDLTDSTSDGLLRRVRKALRKQYGFPRDQRWDIPCVFSTEKAVFPTPDGGLCISPPPNTPLRLDCDSGFGTASFVTGAFGFMAASLVLDGLTRPAKVLQTPREAPKTSHISQTPAAPSKATAPSSSTE